MGILWSKSIYSNNFKDLTRPATMETSSSSLLNLMSINDSVAERYSRDRFQFYANLWEALNSADPTVVDRVLSLEMKNRAQYEKVQESKRDIARSVRYATDIINKPPQAGGDQSKPPQQPQPPQQQSQSTWYSDKKNNPDYTIREWEDDPIHSPLVEAVSTTDRIVFIAITYIFRAITLYLIEWSLYNRMITSFERAFWYYFFIYTSMVILLVMVVNIPTENPTLRMMFYYVSLNIKGGALRVYIHVLVQFLLIIIPFILRETSGTTSQAATFLSFQERQNIISTLSRFTLFMWILTSAIALRI
jgi:hypothetical protein